MSPHGLSVVRTRKHTQTTNGDPRKILDLPCAQKWSAKAGQMIPRASGIADRDRRDSLPNHQGRTDPAASLRDTAKSRNVIATCINGFCNPHRHHSALGRKRPVAFEQKVSQTRKIERIRLLLGTIRYPSMVISAGNTSTDLRGSNLETPADRPVLCQPVVAFKFFGAIPLCGCQATGLAGLRLVRFTPPHRLSLLRPTFRETDSITVDLLALSIS